MELKKPYADGSCVLRTHDQFNRCLLYTSSCVSKTYDDLNRLETLTKARGIVTSYIYAPLTGELVSISPVSYTHLLCGGGGTHP